MDFHRAVKVFLSVRGVRVRELGAEVVHHLSALPGHPDRVHFPRLGGGWGGKGGGGGDSLLLFLLHNENEDEEESQENKGDGEKDGSDESDPSRKGKRGREEWSSL